MFALLSAVAIELRRLDVPGRTRVLALYDELRRRYQAAATDAARQAAGAAFLAGIGEVPQLRELVESFKARGALVVERDLELPADLRELEPRTAAAAPSTRSAPPSGPGKKPTRGLRKSAKKNGGTRAAPPTAGAPAPVGESQRPPLTRYPDLDVPSRVALGSRTSVTVGLRVAAREGSTGVIIADTEEAPPTLELVIRAPGFEIDGSNTQELVVSREEDVEARFVVRAVREGAATMRVDFYQRGRRIGTVAAATTIGPGAIAAAATPETGTLEFLSDPARAADLEMYVGVDRQDPQRLHFTLTSPFDTIDLHHAAMGSVRLQRAPLAEMQLVYTELSRLAGRGPDSAAGVEAQRARLAKIGNELWERLFSEELKASYWRWKDRVRSIQITSEEPWIPWEMVKPFRFDEQDLRVDEPHLCERFAIGRWLAGGGPADRIPVRRLQPVASRSVDLAAVSAELEAFGQLTSLRPGLEALGQLADKAELIDCLERGTFSVLHVASHGGFNTASPDDSGITLSDGDVRPSDINARFGQARPRPIVFINACHGGRLEHAFTGLGGWADRLVRQARVGAFVGAAWEVNDRLALLFAERFYAALLGENKSIGESFRIARGVIRDSEPSNSTWLAYVLYGDPTATVTPPR